MRRGRIGLVLVVSALLLMLVPVLWAQQQSLDEKYKSALELYDQGNLQQARVLLLEIKEAVAGGEITLAPETAKAIDEKLAEIDARLAETPAGEEQSEETEADQRFEELRANPEIVNEMNRREQAAVVRSAPASMEGDQERFEEARQSEDVRRQKTEEEVRARLAEGLTLMGAKRFDEAEKKFLAAQNQVNYSGYADDWKRVWLARVQEHLDSNASERKEYVETLRVLESEKGAAELERHLKEMRDRRDRQMVRLMEQWEIFMDRQQYDDALLVLRQAEILNPTDASIEKKRDLTRRKQLSVENIKLNQTRSYESERHLNSEYERMTPWFPVYRLPDDWKELSEKRLRATVEREQRDTPENRRVRQQLEETVVSFAFTDQPVREALDFLQTLGNINIVADMAKLSDPNQTITLRLSNVSLETAIKLLTEQMGMKYTIRDGVVFISDEEGVKLPPETVVYDVWDLLASLPEFQGPEFELSNLTQSTSGGGGGGGGIWGGGAGGGSTTGETAETPEESLNNLITLISEVIDPDTWQDGSGNAIRGRAGTIIVTNSPEILRKVQQLLADLRKARAIQVMVDIRFVTVTDTWMEEIGFDFGDASNFGFVYQHSNDTITIDSINSLAQAFGAVTPAVLGTGEGLNLTGAFLDDVSVNIFLNAVQRSWRNSIMQAPRLTMMNGQRAYVAVSTQINYVQDLTPIVAELAVGYDPEIATIQDGVVFDVRPTVSADRRYVQLELRPAVARLISIDNYVVFDLLGLVIQLPRLQIQTVRTSVSVPDGGTLLVGGLSYGFDGDAEAGVPMLSKIPVIGKLFTRRGTDQERQFLLILVKPTIIIQEEYEAGAN